MAAFADMSAAETRAYAKVNDHTWVNAHAQRGSDGTIGVRVQRYMSSLANGEWVVITDDATV